MTESSGPQGEVPFQSILIYGMGMMGASLSLSIRDSKGFQGSVTGVVRSERSASYIREHNIADGVVVQPDLPGVSKMDLAPYDCVILGLPVQSVVDIFPELPAYSGVITDMSSTRREVHRAAALRPDLTFVGSHPMCGSEDAGPAAARSDLYRDRLCILTEKGAGEGASRADVIVPTKSSGGSSAFLSEAGQRVEQLWKAIGMHTLHLDPDDHDRTIAYLSHSPHLISGLMALWAGNSSVVEDATSRSPISLIGGGFRDMVRIAGSNPEMWSDILETNRDHIIESLSEYARDIEGLIESLRKEPRSFWMEWFRKARQARNRICGYPEDA